MSERIDTLSTDLRADDYLELIALGEHPDRAARRVGLSRRTIERHLRERARGAVA